MEPDSLLEDVLLAGAQHRMRPSNLLVVSFKRTCEGMTPRKTIQLAASFICVELTTSPTYRTDPSLLLKYIYIYICM